MILQNKINKIRKFSYFLKKNILKMSYVAGSSSSHLGGALSIVEIISILFAYKMNIDKNNPLFEDRDRFILSKGHACLAYYAALCNIGFIKFDELDTFEKNETNLLGHPVINKNIGIEFSTGSLGMGLSLAIGVALAAKKKQKDYKVYVILGDGECNEGSIWEAAMAAPNFNLDNLHVILDKNNYQQTGSNKDIMNSYNLLDKWQSFGWHTDELDGHNLIDMVNYFDNLHTIKKPSILLANTIKGKGFSFTENDNSWHHAPLSKSLYDKALNELEEK